MAAVPGFTLILYPTLLKERERGKGRGKEGEGGERARVRARARERKREGICLPEWKQEWNSSCYMFTSEHIGLP